MLGIANIAAGQPGMTARLTVQYRRPTPLFHDLRFRAWVERVEGRRIMSRGEVWADDVLTAEAEGIFVQPRPELAAQYFGGIGLRELGFGRLTVGRREHRSNRTERVPELSVPRAAGVGHVPEVRGRDPIGGTGASAARQDEPESVPALERDREADPAPVRPAPRRALDRRSALLGAAVMLLVALVGFVWIATRDDGDSSDTNDAVAAVRDAEQTANESPLFEAQTAATVMYADRGSYLDVTPEALQRAQASIAWVTGDANPAIGEVSVRPVDAESMVLSTTLPSGACQAMLLAPSGVSQIPAYAPCAAANVQPPGQSGHADG